MNFWTYSCINSLRPLPYMKSWAAKYHDAGLVVLGVHTPEFSFEKVRANVAEAISSLGITYRVVMDSDYKIWHSFDNEYWPAFYLLDGKGRIRYRAFGEGAYDQTERAIQSLLKENGAAGISGSLATVSGMGVELAANTGDEQSPETYAGYRLAEHFASTERLRADATSTYSLPSKLSLNYWGLGGSWNVGAESAAFGRCPARSRFDSTAAI